MEKGQFSKENQHIISGQRENGWMPSTAKDSHSVSVAVLSCYVTNHPELSGSHNDLFLMVHLLVLPGLIHAVAAT